MKTEELVLVDGVRTPMIDYNGAFAEVSAIDLAAHAARALLAEAGRARLVWRPSEAPDLAGYIVYRKGATGDFVRLTAKPILATSYVDATVVSGQAYDYRVTAIDQAGNESAPAEVHASVP